MGLAGAEFQLERYWARVGLVLVFSQKELRATCYNGWGTNNGAIVISDARFDYTTEL